MPGGGCTQMLVLYTCMTREMGEKKNSDLRNKIGGYRN